MKRHHRVFYQSEGGLNKRLYRKHGASTFLWHTGVCSITSIIINQQNDINKVRVFLSKSSSSGQKEKKKSQYKEEQCLLNIQQPITSLRLFFLNFPSPLFPSPHSHTDVISLIAQEQWPGGKERKQSFLGKYKAHSTTTLFLSAHIL